MIDVTLNIANQLAEIVPDAIIYREQQEQSFEEPSFYIYEIQSNSKDELMDYQMRSHLYCVVWFPDSSLDDPGVKEQCENMRQKLLDELSFIDGLQVKVLNKEAKINENTLNLTFKIRYRVTKPQENNQLKELQTNGGLKNG